MRDRILQPRLLAAAVMFTSLAAAGVLAARPTDAMMRKLSAAAQAARAAAETRSGATVAAAEEAPIQPASTVTSESTGDSPPAATPVITGTQGLNGWYTSDVSLTWTVEDAETPVTSSSGCAPASVTADTTGQGFTCTATSDGGTTTTTATIARDATVPDALAVTADRAPNEAGWYTAPFTATWNATDATSGIGACTQTTYSGPDVAEGSVEGTCADKAGNTTAPLAFAFKFDATAPVVEAVADRAADANGWYNRAVTVTFSSDDPAATCEAPVPYSGPDTPATTITGGCTDVAGNRGTASLDLRYDATAPVITIVSPSASSYVLNQPVAVEYTCIDATSGAASCTGTTANGGSLDTATVGPHTFTVNATDQAGNPATAAHAYTVGYSGAGVLCGGVAGHQILSPIRTDGSTAAQRNSTVPAKFRVCDFFGKPVTMAGVVESFRVVSVNGAETSQSVTSTSAHEQFRAGESQWIFNVSTKPMQAGSVYGFRIALNDGSSIDFSFRVK